MYIIPDKDTHKFSQTNQSDLFGNISISKSVNFDEEGYLKLSSRSVSLINSETDTNFNISTGFGRVSTGTFYIATTENPYILALADGTSSLIQDTDSGGVAAPTLSFDTYGKWWEAKWHVTTATALFYKTVSNGDWTNTGISALTSGKAHPIESFEKANTLMVGNGNTVRQYNTSYATTSLAQLTINSDYEIISMTYNNNFLGIATRLSDTVTGENKEAQFLTWDGSASSPNASYSVGSDSILGMIAYKSSFVILTRDGQLKYFNGGGFDTLASFPAYFKRLDWGTFISQITYGDTLKVDGDNIYINVLSTATDNDLNTYNESQLGGIWCYDPQIGLYHRQAPSISQMTIFAVEQAGVNTTSNTFTVYSGFSLPASVTLPETGNPIRAIQTTIGGLTQGDMYYIIKSSATTFKLASSYANAIALTPIDITSTGGSFSNFATINVKDFGISRNPRTGGISIFGSKAYVYDDVIFGGEYYDTNSASQYAHLNISVPEFKNIGYFVTTKIASPVIEDNVTKLFAKYRPLKTDDKIIIKYKNKEIVGLPSYADCTATSNTVLTTTSNISKAYGYTGDLECEILSGAGAGQMSKVTSITENAGTYTVTIEDEMIGVSASDSLYIKLDNWSYLYTIDSTNPEDWQEIPLAKVSKWTKFKVILEGSGVTIEELQIINNNYISSV